MQLKEFSYQGKRIVYRTKGEGPPVVLLHGFGEDGTVWRNQYHIFPGHQLIIPDLPGSGKSEMIDDMSMEGMADVIKEMIAPSIPQGGILQPHKTLLMGEPRHYIGSSKSEVSVSANPPLGGRGALIGHSMGGYITLAFAEKYPDRLNAFGLFHSTSYADTDEKKETRRKGMEFIKQHGSGAFLKTTTPNLFSAATKEANPQLIEEQLAGIDNFSSIALVNYYEAMIKRPDSTAVLQNSQIPVLFVMGRWDNAAPLQDVLRQCHLPQLSYIHILDNSGHMGMIEEPNEANKVLAHFIKTVEKQAYT